MLLALIALISFQWYWIQNAITVKNEQFDRKVNETLKTTVRKLEKQEIIYLTKQRLNQEKIRHLLAIANNPQKTSPQEKKKILKSIGNPKNFELANEPMKNDLLNKKYSSNSISKYQKEILSTDKGTLEKLNSAKNNWEYENINLNEIFSYLKMEQVNGDSDQIKGQGKSAKLDLMKNVFKDFMLGKRTIYERFGHLMIDTLLKSEFVTNGIYNPFEYEVKDSGKTIFASMGVKNNSAHKIYRVKLFPNDTFQQEQYLQVSFPQKKNAVYRNLSFIYQNLLKVFGISVILVLLVGGIFLYSVSSLLSQSRLSQIKNDFINNMTHELKTPVSTIKLALEIIKDETLTKTKAQSSRYINIIEQENNRLEKQVEKVLQIAQLEKGDVKLNKEKLNVVTVIDEVVQNLAIQIEQFKVKIVQKNHLDHLNIMADKVHITNVFYNLLDNAIKYSKENPEITIETGLENNYVYIKISDNGLGISKDQVSKVFDKFYRVHTGDVHNVKGFGLGLSYVKKILELHKGEIRVESILNQGSEFTVILPEYENFTS